jgi:hypothetical protein
MDNKKRLPTAFLAGVFLLAMSVPGGPVNVSKTQGWDAWKGRLPVRLAGLTPSVSQLLPIDVKFTLKAAECPNPKREIRLIYRSADGREQEVPFQLSRLRVWDKGIDPKVGEATLNGLLTFFDVSGGEPGGT